MPGISITLSQCLWGSSLAFLLSLLTALCSFYPVQRGQILHCYFASRRRRLPRPIGWSSNVLFFAEIAGTEPEVYLKDFRDAVGVREQGTAIDLNYAKEIVANAEIAVMKLGLFQGAVLLSFLGFVAIGGAGVAHYFRR
jgi:hypothetical protein